MAAVCQRLALAHAARQQRHGHVFQRRELRQQVMKLPDVADLAIAKGRRLLRRELGHVDRGADDRSGGGRIQRAQNVQQRALSRAGLAHDGHHLAGLDIQVEALKEGERAARGGVGLFQIPDLNDGGLAGFRPRLRLPRSAGVLAGDRWRGLGHPVGLILPCWGVDSAAAGFRW